MSDAIGGGPVLVRGRQARVPRRTRRSRSSQLAPRGPRTAVGQRRGRRDPARPTSTGGSPATRVGHDELRARADAGPARRRDAAMALDGGGSSTLAFDGTVLELAVGRQGARRRGPRSCSSTPASTRRRRSRPSSRRTATASPTSSGSRYKIVRPVDRDGRRSRRPTARSRRRSRPRASPGRTTSRSRRPAPGTASGARASRRSDRAAPPAEGRWTLHRLGDRRPGARLDDDARASPSTRRSASSASRRRRVVRPERGRDASTIRWTQARAARVKVTIETPEGIVVRTVVERAASAGRAVARLGRPAGNRKPVAGGRYVVRVTATNELGTVSLDAAAHRRAASRPLANAVSSLRPCSSPPS